MTYGFYRAEALGALATVVIIWYVTGILSYLAVERLHTGEFEIQVHKDINGEDLYNAPRTATTRYLYVVCIYGAICLQILF
jgi:divalent metal cation (Fe/Co/Zn/Cd) transporter